MKILLRTPQQYNSIVITNHAVDRAIQRGRLFFNRLGLNSREEVKNISACLHNKRSSCHGFTFNVIDVSKDYQEF